MSIRIDKKIKAYTVVKPDDAQSAVPPTVQPDPADSIDVPSAEVIQMHERVERPERLEGHTYKIKSPLFEHALYGTINDIVLNEGTEHELRRPYEIFINSKNMEHFQWTVALTRIISAVFRKGGDVTFLAEELKAVFDPRGGYFRAGGVYMPSIIAELGVVIEDHLKKIGMIVGDELTPEQRKLIADKRAAFDARARKNTSASTEMKTPPPADAAMADAEAGGGEAFPPSASVCNKCSAKAVVMMDGCATCLSCGNSKCG